MKIALMRRLDLTEDGYRRKVKISTPETDESPDQFIVRLSTYLIEWLELSKTEKTFERLKDVIVKEQFINSCPKELAVHVRERAPETREEMEEKTEKTFEGLKDVIVKEQLINSCPKELAVHVRERART
ncbi:uncharacterized protein LOC141877678 [Acropora palmata]|uniref:uncharacterized protein LOC141877678 n=1 Tax=Acropora palmata TaxID=6131 RepID=UPI003DA0C4DE